jgi:hypothetical protein
MRVRIHYTPKEEDEQLDVALLLAKNNNVFRPAEAKTLDDELITSQDFLNYNLKANSEYKLAFTRKPKKETNYFDRCRLFTMEITLVSFDK